MVIYSIKKLFNKLQIILVLISLITATVNMKTNAEKQIYQSVTDKTSEITLSELNRASDWFDENIMCVLDGKTPAFSFRYGCKNFGDNLKDWRVSLASDTTDEGKRSVSILMTQKSGCLSVRCEAVQYLTYPTCEWTLWFENTGSENTQVLSDVLPLDGSFEIGKAEKDSLTQGMLYYSNGSNCVATDAFEPLCKTLPSGITRIFNSGDDGRPSYHYMPFFNMDLNNYGVIFGIGWPGCWKSTFTARSDGYTNVKIGQKNLKGCLYAGEKIRSPLVSVQFYEGSVMKGQNVFRRWIVDYNSDNNQRQILSSGSQEYDLMTNATIDNQLAALQKMKDYNVPAEAFWMDAGWYEGCDDDESAWSTERGYWIADKDRFPDGLKVLTDACEENGLDNVLWFEPETVDKGTYFYENYHNYLIDLGKDTCLWNFADDEATQFLSEYICNIIKTYGIDIYRQDFNQNPKPYWENAKVTGETRKGFTENKYVQNFLKFWDYLLEQNPDLTIDNCASGGNRLCLETTRCSQPLWRNDDCYEAIGEQSRTYGLSYWLPYNGGGTLMSGFNDYTQSYEVRSCMSSTLICVYPYSDVLPENKSAETLQSALKLINQYMDIRQYYTKDYYPLTSYSTSGKVIMAFQYNDPDLQEGIVLAYRREGAKENSVTVCLNGLSANERYTLTNIDENIDVVYTGSALMEGVVLSLPTAQSASVFRYAKVQ